ncbi:MAG: hypothetical protein KAH20_07370 [Methylococcales bacterium]|nr:hypothetical protein [Methylococcales bacterium]
MNYHFSCKVDKKILILLFGASIYLPLFTGIFQEDQLSSIIEKRKLAVLPAIPKSAKTINEFPKEFNSYYSDHFGLREQLTSLYFSFIYKIGALNSIGDVTFGKDGWMFLGNIKPVTQHYNDPIGDAINKNLFSEQQLKDFALSIMAIKNWLKKRGIEYIYVIAPNKHTIYFEKLPTYIKKQNEQSATDQLVAYLEQHTDINVVDLRPALFKEKKNHQVFFKTDSHWNFHGANAAQFEIMKKVSSLFPKRIEPTFLEDTQFHIKTRSNGDLASLTKAGIMTEELALPVFKPGCKLIREPPINKASAIDTFLCQKKGLTTVIFKDSFFNYLQTYIARYFHRSVYIPGRIKYSLLQQYVDSEKPDIIIEELVEREFPYLPTNKFIRDLH